MKQQMYSPILPEHATGIYINHSSAPAWLKGLHLSCPADTIAACLWDFCRTRPARVWPELEMALAVLRGGALR